MSSEICIVIFCWKRKRHLIDLIESLKNNLNFSNFPIYIFQDGFSDERDRLAWFDVNRYVKSLVSDLGTHRVRFIERQENIGLFYQITNSLSFVFKDFDKVIVLEDDIAVSENFLTYMSEALVMYEDNKKIASISGFAHPCLAKFGNGLVFQELTSSWGWATWRNRWLDFDPDVYSHDRIFPSNDALSRFNFNGNYMYSDMLCNRYNHKNQSWAILWYLHNFLHKRLTVYPTLTQVSYHGSDGSGVHKDLDDRFVAKEMKPVNLAELSVSQQDVYRAVCRFYRETKLGFFARIKRKWRTFK